MVSPKRYECTSCPTQLRSIRELVRASCEDYGLDKSKIDQIVLAIDEACANVMRHGYHNSKEGYICLETYVEAGCAIFVLKDRCPKISKETLAPSENNLLEPGGLGLHLINEVMDSLELISHDGQGNHLKMKIKL